MNKRNLVLSTAAGLVGGALSTHILPLSAHAQSQAPQEIQAQRYTLVNQEGVSLGSFSFDNSCQSPATNRMLRAMSFRRC